jgi:formylmethanofuran dehydrogenase subunit C
LTVAESFAICFKLKRNPTCCGHGFWLLFAGLLAARDLSAQDITETWNNNTYGSWNDPNNWTPAGVPNNGGGTNYTATVTSGGPTLADDVALDGLNYNGGDISGSSYTMFVSDNFNVSGTTRVLGIASLVLGPDSQSQWASGNIDIWGTTQIHNYGTFTESSAADLALEIDPAHTTRNTLGGTFFNESGSTFNVSGTGTLTFGGDFKNSGTFNQSGHAITFNGAAGNTGTIRQSGGTMLANGTFRQTAGIFYVTGSAILQGNVTFQGGRLMGSGTVSPYGNLSVTTGAVIDPGDDLAQAGRLTITTALTLAGGGVLHADIGGTTAGLTYDQTVTANYPTLAGGVLELSLINGFTPTTDDTFTILTTSDSSFLNGSFANVADGGRLTTDDDSGSFLVQYGTGANSGSVVLSGFMAVPEPGALALLATVLPVAAIFNRRRINRRR